MGHVTGMGAVVHIGGTTFRVWAPHASAVSVIGDFNSWQPGAHPLTPEGDSGHWVTTVTGVSHGAAYRFSLTTAAGELSKIDPYAQHVTNSIGNALVHDHDRYDWGGDEGVRRPFNELVVYEAHVGSFFTEPGQVGTFAEVEAKLDHLVDLGVTALQLMPVMEFAGDYSWGYNPSHIFAVESGYGGPDGLKDLVKAAHSRGLAVLIDVVYNHVGPSDLDLWQFDGWHPEGASDKGGIYFYNDDRSHTPWGDTRPDYGRPEVRDFLRDNALMWLRDYHADGLRYDMTPYMRSVDASGFDIPDGWSLQRWMNEELRAEFPGRILIAEDLHGEPRVTSTEPDGAAFHAQWDNQFVHPVRAAATATDDAERSVASVQAAVEFSYGDAFARVVYTESHDEVANGKARVPQEADASDPKGYYAQKLSTLGAALVFTTPGIPMIFQGQEFLQGEWFRDNVPLDWALNEEFHGIVKLYRDLIALRLGRTGKTKGLLGPNVNVFLADDTDKVLAFHRWMDGGPGDDTVVVVNLSHEPHEAYVIGMPAAGEWELVLNSDATAYSDDFGNHWATTQDVAADSGGAQGLSDSMTISIGPYTVLVYARKS